jgi:hypothetical protein
VETKISRSGCCLRSIQIAGGGSGVGESAATPEAACGDPGALALDLGHVKGMVPRALV